jgi:hypothetical protein
LSVIYQYLSQTGQWLLPFVEKFFAIDIFTS